VPVGVSVPDHRPHRLRAWLAVGVVAAAAVVAATSAAATSGVLDRGARSGTVREARRPSGVAPGTREGTVRAARRVGGGHGDLVAAVLVACALALGAALRLRRGADARVSRQVLHGLVRGRSPPLLPALH
jgi:hypothetical protein